MASGDEQLISYILKAREKGRNDEDITRSLCSVGWRKERVDAAFVKISDMKEAGETPVAEKPDAPAKPPQILPGRVKLSAVPVSQVQSQEKQIQRVTPPPIKRPVQQEEQTAEQQERAHEAEGQTRPAMPPTIQAPEEKAPLELPMAPQYQKVADEREVQNPAFPKIAGGTSRLDTELITRVILFVIIVAIVVYGYLYITRSAPKIS